MARDCRKCQTYQGCVGKEWYTYTEIRFCPLQILWIIEKAETLIKGWPPDPESSGHIDPKIKTRYRSEAYFAKPMEILAEVNYRVKRAGVNGKLLRAEVVAGLELSAESRDALMYCKGKWRKRMSFSAWKKQRKYYQKVN